MVIYLKCIRGAKITDDEGHPEAILREGTIYIANQKFGRNYACDTGLFSWSPDSLKEISQANAFCLLKGNMDLVEELP